MRKLLFIAISLMVLVISCDTNLESFNEIKTQLTSNKVRSTDNQSRYIWTDDYKVTSNHCMVINGETFPFEGKIKRGKNLFKISGGVASAVLTSPEEIGYMSISESGNELIVNHTIKDSEVFIIPEGFEGYSTFNNSIIVIDNVAIRGTGGVIAWIIMGICILILIASVGFALMSGDDKGAMIAALIVSGLSAFIAYVMYALH